MKKIFLMALACVFISIGSAEASSYEPVENTTTRTKATRSKSKSRSGASSTKSTLKSGNSSSSTTSSVPAWLPGKYVYERLDPTFYEIVYEIYEIGKDGYMRFGQSSSKYGTPNNPKFKYSVKGNVLYDDINKPLLKLNSSNKSVSSYSDSSRTFIKVK